MRHIPRIYYPENIDKNQLINISGEALNHIAKSLRRHIGDVIILFNGQGGEYLTEIVNISSRAIEAKVLEFINIKRESEKNIHLGLAISKPSNFEIAIQKAVELGVTSITPIISQYSEPDNKAQNKIMRLEKIIIHAAQQSGRTLMPKLNNPEKIDSWIIKNNNPDFYNIILHPYTEKPIMREFVKNSNINLLIGSEGGFSDNEIELATKNNFNAFKLGNLILRTETAVISALSILIFNNQ